MNKTRTYIRYFDTPLGEMKAGVRDNHLFVLEFSNREHKANSNDIREIQKNNSIEDNHALFDVIERQLKAYFSGNLKEFSIPLDATGTDFSTRTWQLLQTIPYGDTISYIELAQMHGDIKKVRAVGRANGSNRIAIIIPCHRVVGKDGSLVGYAGELWRKKELLDLEAKFSGKAYQPTLRF